VKPTLILILLVAGCATRPVSIPAPDCPASIPIPAPLVGTPTAAKVSALEIRVELAREQERARGDCWRSAVMGVKQ
jgi:hypothetical protein